MIGKQRRDLRFKEDLSRINLCQSLDSCRSVGPGCVVASNLFRSQPSAVNSDEMVSALPRPIAGMFVGQSQFEGTVPVGRKAADFLRGN